jgi:hypothetical protein
MPTVPASLDTSLGAAFCPPRLQRRLREVWRSAGWPCQDTVEIELLAAGWLERQRHADGRETLRVTDAGVAVLARSVQAQRGRLAAHEALVARVAREMSRAGRIAWRGLSLRARVPSPQERSEELATVSAPAGIVPPADPGGASPAEAARAWVVAMPDVFSIRHTTVEEYLEPIVHEIKVSRADLLSDLRHPHKSEAYLAMSSQCWYVLREGIARVEEIPPLFGVIEASAARGLEVLRPAPRRAVRPGLSLWMALARATPEPSDDDAQPWLADVPDALNTERPSPHAPSGGAA